MPTSGTYTWTANRDFVITQAFKKINALGNFESLDTPRLNDGINTLNPILKHYATMGMPLWAIVELNISMSLLSLSSGVNIGIGQPLDFAAPLKILHSYRRVNTYDVPMQMYTRVEYNNLSNKESYGTPIGIYYQPKGDVGNLKCWPLPSPELQTSGTINITYQRPFQDAGSATDILDFPTEWNRTLILALAYDLAPNYGLDVTQRDQLGKMLKGSVDEILGFSGEEGSFFIQPARRL